MLFTSLGKARTAIELFTGVRDVTETFLPEHRRGRFKRLSRNLFLMHFFLTQPNKNHKFKITIDVFFIIFLRFIFIVKHPKWICFPTHHFAQTS